MKTMSAPPMIAAVITGAKPDTGFRYRFDNQTKRGKAAAAVIEPRET
jgi:hypothetical protein